MQSNPARRTMIMRLIVGLLLFTFGASHGITGFLANVGWYNVIGVDFDAWYMHPAYQSMCWFANGIAVAILLPMWVGALWHHPLSEATNNRP